MDLDRWLRFERIIDSFGLKPILAVVPENCDPELVCGPADPEFWQRMQRLQAGGASIGLHGFRHVCEGVGGGLIPLHKRTEFAGVDEKLQREWIRAGLSILRGHGLDPRIWVAPRHGFDRATLAALSDAGIGLVSDGFAREPFQEHGLVWIPQQLWEPIEKTEGFWTICIHANNASDEAVAALENFLERYSDSFTSVNDIARRVSRTRDWRDRIFHRRMIWRIAFSTLKKRLMARG